MSSGYRTPVTSEGVDQAIARLARRQYGLVSRRQALASGASRSLVQRRLAAARWEQVFTGVYRLAGIAPSWRQNLLAACLAVGGDTSSSHRSAARLWRLAGFEEQVLQVSVQNARQPRLFPGSGSTGRATLSERIALAWKGSQSRLRRGRSSTSRRSSTSMRSRKHSMTPSPGGSPPCP